MISNERPSPPGFSPYASPPQKKAALSEETLKVSTIQVERKTFIFTLKENPRGRFLRITEDVNGRRDNLIIPSTGLDEFLKILDQMAKASADMPQSSQSQGGHVPLS